MNMISHNMKAIVKTDTRMRLCSSTQQSSLTRYTTQLPSLLNIVGCEARNMGPNTPPQQV